MVASSRPEWARALSGIPLDTVARVHGGAAGARQDIQLSRSRVSVVRPGALQPAPEDEFDVSFVYGPEASTADVHARSVAPLVRKAVEGYNACVVLFGATGSGKTTTLQGGRGRDGKGAEGLVHLAAAELFELACGKAVTVGEAVARRRRVPSSKGFDFFVESSFVEVYDERARDLYARGPAARAALPVMEDMAEGYVISGLSSRAARSAQELRADYDEGCAARDTQAMDLGSVHERAAAIFTVSLSQYAPAAVHGEEDRVMVSRLLFVDCPGSERLGMDPEVLRLREGLGLNRGLLSLAALLRRLGEPGGSLGPAGYEDSLLTRLLADVFGGNCITLVVATLRQGDWASSATTLRALAAGRGASNFPLINHGRARGLLHKLRSRLMAVMEDRELLRDQLRAAPAEGDPADMAISVAKLRDLEARLLEEREEKAALASEKAALAARLARLKDAGTDELREKAELQEALVRSEEGRLEVSRALIDFQLEANEAKQEWANARFALEQRVLELESGRLEHFVRAEDHAALEDERGRLAAQCRAAAEAEARLQAALAAERAAGSEAQQEVRRLSRLLAALEAASAGDAGALLAAEEEENGGAAGAGAGGRPGASMGVRAAGSQPGGGAGAGAAAAAGRVNLQEVRLQLQRQLRQQERRSAELEAKLSEVQEQLEAAQSSRSVTQEALDAARSLFQRRMEGAAREVADLAQRVAAASGEPVHMLSVGPEELMARMAAFLDEALRAGAEAAAEARRDAADLSSRHSGLRRRLRQLYCGYRALRYRLQDEWPAGFAPPRVAHEDAVLAGSVEDIVRADDEAERQALVKQQGRASALEAELSRLKVRDTMAAGAAGKLGGRSALGAPPGGLPGPVAAALQLENARLREEIGGLKRRLPQLGLLRRTGSGALAPPPLPEAGAGAPPVAAGGGPAAAAALGRLAAQLAAAQSENRRLLAGAGGGGGAPGTTAGAGGAPPAAGAERGTGAGGAGGGSEGDDGGARAALRRQLREFTVNTAAELERKLKACESRAVMAEEQLDHLQARPAPPARYLATAVVAYQREIVRLRGLLGTSAAAGMGAALAAERAG